MIFLTKLITLIYLNWTKMTKYYFHDGEKELGGFSKEELKKYSIKKDTPIWFEALDEWTTADKIEDLLDIIEKKPPALSKKTSKQLNNNGNLTSLILIKKNRFYLAATIGLLFVFIIIYGLKENPLNIKNQVAKKAIKTENNKNNKSLNDSTVVNQSIPIAPKKTADEIKQDLLKIEQKSPLNYISIEASERPNKVRTRHGTFFRSSKYEIDGVLVEGYILNNATLAVFKDIEYRIDYVSATGTVISSERFTIYNFLYPNNNLEIKQKIYPPEGTSYVNYKVLKASHN